MKQKLTEEQLIDLCTIIGDWYFEWKDKMTDNGETHRLGFAREDLKRRIEQVTDL